MPMIKSIKLINFKCYQKQKFDLCKLTVFCGSNSVGKSTAIQALSIPLQSRFKSKATLNGELVEVGFTNDIHNKNLDSPSDEDRLAIELNINDNIISWGYDDLEVQNEESNNQLNISGCFNSETKQLVDDLLTNFQYLQAERYGPKNNYDLSQSYLFHNHWLGAKGEFTAELLASSENFTRINIGQFTREERIRDIRKHQNIETYNLIKNINAWMDEISPGITISPKIFTEASVAVNTFNQNGQLNIKPLNVGFGVSYALSIVTALLLTKPNGLVIIENPEAHLHPKGQSYLGRLIALTAMSGIQVIVETHSDHLLNGIRVATRLNEACSEGVTKVFYISSGETQSDVEEINIGKKGELSSWPKGFFDQQAMDIRVLMSGQES
ncbi:DUF3696 domain-containing protein [Aliivibrio fischeri]|uniref:DUF3696 domain-containing protein n=1 Tax=Aliivibrio fischeri TaxID=668 RepID=UPI003734D904